jgi:hypothetical protein
MSPEKVLYTLLDADVSVAAIVGDRIYQDARPEGDALPGVVIGLVSDNQIPPIDSTPGQQVWQARLDAICIATGSAAAKTLADAVLLAANLQSGSIGGVTVASVIADGRGPSLYDPLTELYTQPVEFTILYYR